MDKGDPAKNAGGLPTRPWTVKVEGKVAKQLTFDIDDLLKLRPLEDRVYRHRCVEAWSMVIPWVGYSLSELIKQCNPLPSANYVQFLSYYDRNVEKWAYEDATIYWPYSEGLRMDEAMNPLTLLTFGLYGQTLPNQDGAPSASSFPGSTASNPPSPSSPSASWTKCRTPPGTTRPPMSTASTPT